MKYLVAIFTVVALASCGAKKDTTTTNTGSASTGTQTETTSTATTNSSLTQEVKVATGEISSGSTDEAKVEKVSMAYKNPKGETTDTSYSYTLDSEGKIATISFEGYNHGGRFFAEAEKQLVGKTLEEAKNLYVSGASLASDGFKATLK